MSRSRLLAPAEDGAEALLLPEVPIERLDAVIAAAGSRTLPAIAVLVSALGWFLAQGFGARDAQRVARAVPAAVARATALHGEARGQG